MTGSTRWGITIPVEGIPLHRQAEVARELEGLGYTDLWSGEGTYADGFTPLAVAAAVTTQVHLGIAIAPVFTRGPALLAQTAATLAATAPGRFSLGLGSSSDVIVERWNAVPFTRPLTRTRDLLRFLRQALAGERVDEQFDTFAVRGFRSAIVPDPPPKLLVAGLRGKMLALAGAEADGAILNWLSAPDVAQVAPAVLTPAGHTPAAQREIVARLMVVPTADAEVARRIGRRAIAAYLNVGVYKAFHQDLGRDALEPMWKLWAAGDRAGALAAIPDHVVDELIVHGPPEACREHLARYVAHGVAVPVIYVLRADGGDPMQACRDLAPR
ncbi:LLM class F420-dependent oxidoreductase [Pseudofrankia sp. DC12]|uniref:LLM class F420-dependent oxidoreductase n=1 Tax=Pseudofrankia sp. DC12 TaxID=683315 RepID=UPI000A4ABF88|nr:LLM class F420-dependent oxidoreductase [Pseudofrankia sp. DC12]